MSSDNTTKFIIIEVRSKSPSAVKIRIYASYILLCKEVRMEDTFLASADDAPHISESDTAVLRYLLSYKTISETLKKRLEKENTVQHAP